MRKLLEKKEIIISEMEDLLNNAETETRALQEDELMKYDELKTQLEALVKTIAAIQENKELTKDEGQGEEVMNTEKRDYEMEVREITSSTHGNAIPEGLHNEILRKIKEKSQVYSEAKSVNYVGDLAILIDGEDAEASILDETEELTETDLGNVEKVVMKDKRVATLVTVSKHMLNNSPVLTLDFIADKVASRVANTIEKQIFNANGGSKQMTSGLLAKGSKVSQSITIENIMAMVSGLKAGYLKGAKFYCNRETFQTLAGLMDGNKRPYLVADVIDNTPAYKILGVPVVVTDVLNGELVLANIGEAIMIKHGQQPTVELLQETFALKGSYGVMCETFVDCAVVNPEAVVILLAPTRARKAA